jgi:hypothetical protein
MKKLICTSILAAFALQFAAAAEDADSITGANPPSATDDSTTAPAAADASKIQLKTKSSFVLEESGRNPFWPIGWKPSVRQAGETTTAVPVASDVSANAFLVSSITLGSGQRFAIINGRPMTEGQVFGLQTGSTTYQITVKSIEDGRVILLRRDQEIEVPLRRR